MDSKFTGPKPPGYTMVWAQRWRPSQVLSKAEDDRRTPGNAADDLGYPTSGTD